MSSKPEKQVTVVVQRCDKASLLVDNRDKWVHVGWGLVVYVSFARGTTDETVRTAARKVLLAPVLTRGVWGDGARPRSVAQFCQEQQAATRARSAGATAQQPPPAKADSVRDDQHPQQPAAETAALASGNGGAGGVGGGSGAAAATAADAGGADADMHADAREAAACPDILVIPQAALTNKYSGKNIQYRSQCGREDGARLFALFLDQLRDPLAVHPDDPALQRARARQNMAVFLDRKAAAEAEVRLAPEEFFRQASEFREKYGAFDDAGIPTRLADGTAISKNARKKLLKIAAAHAKRHAQHQAAQQPAATDGDDQPGAVPQPQQRGQTSESQRHLGTGGATGDAAAADRAPTSRGTEPAMAMPRVVSGTFGNRQALRLESDMGPFTHMFAF